MSDHSSSSWSDRLLGGFRKTSDRLSENIAPVGNTTGRNAAAHGAVTVLWPPREPTGYSLIVDGTAMVDGDQLRLTPNRAVLHRSPDGVHDCVSFKA